MNHKDYTHSLVAPKCVSTSTRVSHLSARSHLAFAASGSEPPSPKPSVGSTRADWVCLEKGSLLSLPPWPFLRVISGLSKSVSFILARISLNGPRSASVT